MLLTGVEASPSEAAMKRATIIAKLWWLAC
jgi:hypothetical protein